MAEVNEDLNAAQALPVDESQSVSAPPSLQDYVHKDDVAALVHNRTKAAIEKTKRETEDRMRQQNSGTSIPDDLIQRKIAEELERQETFRQQQMQEESIRQIGRDFMGKMKDAEEKYPGLANEVHEMGFTASDEGARVLIAANSFDNTADIVAELKTHPNKYGQLLALSKASPKLAHDEMRRLSESIKRNQDATTQSSPTEPLNRIRSSISSLDSGGDESVSALRKRPEFRY